MLGSSKELIRDRSWLWAISPEDIGEARARPGRLRRLTSPI